VNTALLHEPAPGATSKLGTKFECFQCGAKFYDLNRPEALCPKCGEDQAKAPKEAKTRRVIVPAEEEIETEIAPSPKNRRSRTVLDEDEQEVEIEVEPELDIGLDEPVDLDEGEDDDVA